MACGFPEAWRLCPPREYGDAEAHGRDADPFCVDGDAGIAEKVMTV